jgi:membrane protease YdiL (CAAX protease family)
MKFLEKSLDGTNSFGNFLIVVIGSFFAANFIGALPLIGAIILQIVENGGSFDMTHSTFGLSQNLYLFCMLFSFIVGFFALILLIKWMHKRSFAETINGTNKVRWNRIFFGAAVWFILLAVYMIIYYIADPENFVFQFNLKKFIPLFLITVLLMPFQTSYEELMFRGYIAQSFAGWTKNRWIAIIIPSIFFGLMHSFNPEVKEYGFLAAMPQYIIIGLLFGIISILDDGIELAMGMHAINNIFLSLFVTNSSSVLQTPAVLEQLNINVTLETMVMLISGIIAVLIFTKKYKWNFSILNKKVKIYNEESSGL